MNKTSTSCLRSHRPASISHSTRAMSLLEVMCAVAVLTAVLIPAATTLLKLQRALQTIDKRAKAVELLRTAIAQRFENAIRHPQDLVQDAALNGSEPKTQIHGTSLVVTIANRKERWGDLEITLDTFAVREVDHAEPIAAIEVLSSVSTYAVEGARP